MKILNLSMSYIGFIEFCFEYIVWNIMIEYKYDALYAWGLLRLDGNAQKPVACATGLVLGGAGRAARRSVPKTVA